MTIGLSICNMNEFLHLMVMLFIYWALLIYHVRILHILTVFYSSGAIMSGLFLTDFYSGASMSGRASVFLPWRHYVWSHSNGLALWRRLV